MGEKTELSLASYMSSLVPGDLSHGAGKLLGILLLTHFLLCVVCSTVDTFLTGSALFTSPQPL